MPLSTVATGREDVTSPWPVREERRVVSVLFADIVGSTALTERLDPEDVRALQRAYFDTVAGVLRHWHGVVEKYVGDAVMALFGARRSDGLDAYRAVRAALEIQRALDRRPMPGGVRLRVRVGVATGEAVVDLAAARDGGHGAASGAVTTTAARLQEYAPAGGVVVCAATHRATADLVDQRALAPVALAGKALPVDAWRVTSPARPRRPRHEGPLVGRRRELATAQDQLVRAAREHRPRWVSLVGPDGIGRSRLLHELRHGLREVDGVAVRWCVAHCPPYPRGALGPVAELVRDLAGVRDSDPPAVVHRRLTALVDGLIAPARATPTVAALAALLAAPEGTAPATGGPAACRQLLLALAARQPVVVAVDDLDRAGPELDRFLRALFAAATLRGLPLAVVATHRPQLADPLPVPDDRRCRVALAPLGAVDTGRLLRRLLRRAGRPAALAGRLLPLVGGVPGYAGAYVAATGDGEPGLPEAVRRMASARLDLLDDARRAVLTAGAALGVGFTAPAVDRLLGWSPGRAAALLRRLTTADVLLRCDRHGRYEIVDRALRRTAYDRLPRAVRAEFARRAAQWRATASGRVTSTRSGTPAPRLATPRPADAESAPALAVEQVSALAAEQMAAVAPEPVAALAASAAASDGGRDHHGAGTRRDLIAPDVRSTVDGAGRWSTPPSSARNRVPDGGTRAVDGRRPDLGWAPRSGGGHEDRVVPILPRLAAGPRRLGRASDTVAGHDRHLRGAPDGRAHRPPSPPAPTGRGSAAAVLALVHAAAERADRTPPHGGPSVRRVA
ncbi:AAA ATPase domain-containing protein [Micromonospora purpureochromogenes]|uniref:AAA ATPase domain-containing protein n=1 Tax=Micromonospora purpureochromogenes TaxID=47872 RepID=A0A1C4Y0P1_9ACTN|nr:adenylate/guanylate cyclase domain-containing protein [Micromonospora purpureochromogenes]SCF14250.1 AAA ATPase domain-containing protein [Micromonospora purpureochromogenes]